MGWLNAAVKFFMDTRSATGSLPDQPTAATDQALADLLAETRSKIAAKQSNPASGLWLLERFGVEKTITDAEAAISNILGGGPADKQTVQFIEAAKHLPTPAALRSHVREYLDRHPLISDDPHLDTQLTKLLTVSAELSALRQRKPAVILAELARLEQEYLSEPDRQKQDGRREALEARCRAINDQSFFTLRPAPNSRLANTPSLLDPAGLAATTEIIFRQIQDTAMITVPQGKQIAERAFYRYLEFLETLATNGNPSYQQKLNDLRANCHPRPIAKLARQFTASRLFWWVELLCQLLLVALIAGNLLLLVPAADRFHLALRLAQQTGASAQLTRTVVAGCAAVKSGLVLAVYYSDTPFPLFAGQPEGAAATNPGARTGTRPSFVRKGRLFYARHLVSKFFGLIKLLKRLAWLVLLPSGLITLTMLGMGLLLHNVLYFSVLSTLTLIYTLGGFYYFFAAQKYPIWQTLPAPARTEFTLGEAVPAPSTLETSAVLRVLCKLVCLALSGLCCYLLVVAVNRISLLQETAADLSVTNAVHTADQQYLGGALSGLAGNLYAGGQYLVEKAKGARDAAESYVLALE